MPEILKNEDVKILRQGSIDLLIESYSSVGAILQIRGIAKEQAIAADIVTTTNRALQSTIIDITDTPIFLTARTSTRGVKRGALYVKVSMRVDGVVVAILMAGYVAETNKIAYPGGNLESSLEGPGLIRSITGTDPAAGANILETVPTGARWRLISFRFSLVTDATVMNRQAFLAIDDGVNTLTESGTAAVQPASTTYQYQAGNWNSPANPVAYSSYIINILNIYLEAGYRIKSSVANFQAGDNLSAPQYLVEEWIQP